MPVDPLLKPLPLLEVAHVAHRLSRSPGYVRKLIRDHLLPAILDGREWRIDPLDLQAYIDARRVRLDADRPSRREGDGASA